MNALNGIKNTLQLVNDNWSTIVIIAGLAVGVYNKAKKYMALSKQEKIDLAWANLRETILAIVLKVEQDPMYSDLLKTGEAKRAEVIDQIFKDYPILNAVTDKEAVIRKIDAMIDESLVTIKKFAQQ